MSKTQAKEFIRRLAGNESLRDELNHRLDLDELDENDQDVFRERLREHVPSIGSEMGYEFTAEEGFSALEEYRSESQSDELSNEELNRVAGGKSEMDIDQKGSVINSTVSLGIGCAIVSAGSAAYGNDCGEQLGL